MIEVDTINIWYSPGIRKWNVCSLRPVSNGILPMLIERERLQFDTFVEAINYVTENLKGIYNHDTIDSQSN